MVTIIIPILNTEKELYTCIKSIIQQKYTPCEIILVDGARNTKSALKIAEEYRDKVKYVPAPGTSIYEAMNLGAKHATHDYLYFMGSDDQLTTPEVFCSIFDYQKFKKFPKIIISSAITNTRPFTLFKFIYLFFCRLVSHSVVNCGMVYSHQSILTFKDFFWECGGFNTKYMLAADYDFYVKACLSDDDVTYTNISIARTGIKGISSQPDKMLNIISEYLEIIKKNNLKPGFFLYLQILIVKIKLFFNVRRNA